MLSNTEWVMHKNMFYYIFFTIYSITFSGLLFCCQYSKQLADGRGSPSSALLAVLGHTSCNHTNNFASIVEKTQKFHSQGGWRRDEIKERYEMEEIFAEKKSDLLPLYKQLELVDARYPSKKEYTYGLFFGAWISEARRRQHFLFDLLKNKNVRVNKLIVLTGRFDPAVQENNVMEKLLNAQNGLISFKKEWKYNCQPVETETEMMKILFDQAQDADCLNGIKIVYTDTKVADDKKRTTTNDTIKDFCSQNYEPGSIVAISSQPYRYQEAGLKMYLPESFKQHTLDVVGPEAEEMTPNCIYLDSLARLLWQEQEIVKNRK